MTPPFARRFRTCLVLCAAVASSALGHAPAPAAASFYNVRNFGAKGDGAALETGAINRAIAECNRAGGGTVSVPAGTYLVGTLTMLSNVTLDLDAGSVIRGSGDMRDYPPLAYTSEDRSTALIDAIDAHDIAITGRGTIDGNADAFAHYGQADKEPDCVVSYTRQGERYNDIGELPDDGPVTHGKRPGILVLLLRCERILVSGIHIVNAPNWCLHAACSQDVVFSHLEIKSSMLLANADGIDGSFCRNVRVSDCNIEAGDDAIAFAACADGYGTLNTENIVVENCTLVSRSNGIRIGWGAHSGHSDFKDLLFSNIVIRNSNRGIGIYVRADESVENAIFSNIIIETRLYKGRWWAKGEPVLLSAVRADWSKGPMGRIRNVRFSNLMVTGEEGIVVAGCSDSPIEDVVLEGISQRMSDGPLVRSYGGNFDFRPAADESLRVFKHDIPALYASHVKNLTIRHFTVDRDPALPDFVRDGLDVEDFDGLTVDGFEHRQLPPNGNAPGIAVRLRDGRRAAISNCAGGLGDASFVSAENVRP
ncbi:MAG TPA: glycosyl hydrolase family 28 protein [Opitutaceae bacterium]